MVLQEWGSNLRCRLRLRWRRVHLRSACHAKRLRFEGGNAAACGGSRAFEGRQQPLRLDDRQAEALSELLARVRAGWKLAQVGDRVCPLIREPTHGALEARRVRAEVERFE